MSVADFTPFVEPSKAPALSKEACKHSLSDYPPALERLIGVWGPLSREPYRGITSAGVIEPDLFSWEPDGAPVSEAAQAALRWLQSLSPEVRAKVTFPVDSERWRHWNNTPLILQDPQIELLVQSPIERQQALEVVRASLSSEGYARVREVMNNNLFMGRLIGMTDVLNEWAFTLSIFGEPSSESPWGWQLFGHHLALNCMFVGGRMTLSPVFMGLEPDHDHGPDNRRMFLPHENHALAFMHSLTNSQRRHAILQDSMLTADQLPERYHPDDGRQRGGAYQDNRVIPYEGVLGASLDRAQRLQLLDLAALFIRNMPDGPFDARMREIERYLDRTYFSWIGPVNEVDPFYFRIHGPVALVEFDHHSGIFLSNEDPARFHVHTIVRTPNGNDYGKDLLRQHYAAGGHDRQDRKPHHGHEGVPHSHDGGRTVHRHD